MGQQDMLARLLRGNPDPGLPGYPVMQSSEDRGFAPMPRSFADAGARMAAVLRGDVEPTPEEGRQIATVRGFTEGPATIRAFHGSPHRFDRFDMSRIGTGEGAQAYGHGLYFAGNERVARAYRDQLAPLNLSVARSNLDAQGTAARLLDSGLSVPQAIEELDGRLLLPHVQRGLAKRDPDTMAFVSRLAEAKDILRNPNSQGYMYEVNLNTTPDRLLDWDAPLSGQSPIRSLIGDLGQQYANAGSAEARNVARDAFMAAKNENLSGAGVYNQLTRLANTGGAIGEHLGPLSPRMMSGPSVASQTLREEAGIEGIQYLDQGSRAAGDGTRNYVMFDDKLIDILRRYGIAGTLGGGAAATSGTSE
jgi:hypothetical protein